MSEIMVKSHQPSYLYETKFTLMKSVLLPTDFSENSINAIDYAMDLFKNLPCEFILFNIQKPSEYVTDDIYTSDPSSNIYQSISNDNRKKLEELKGKYLDRFADQPFQFDALFDFDTLTDAIHQIVSARNINLIIMGTNGATDAAEIIFGSNTLKVIREVRCPILVVPEKFKFSKLSSILFTLRESDVFHPNALLPIEDIIRDRQVDLEVLQLDTEQILPDIPLIKQFKGVNYHPIQGVPTVEAISSYEQLLPVDMHVIFIKPKSFFERIFMGSDTAKISYSSPVPLLVLKS